MFLVRFGGFAGFCHNRHATWPFHVSVSPKAKALTSPLPSSHLHALHVVVSAMSILTTAARRTVASAPG